MVSGDPRNMPWNYPRMERCQVRVLSLWQQPCGNNLANSTVKDLKAKLLDVCTDLSSVENLMVVEVYQHKLFRYFTERTNLTEIRESDEVFAYEVHLQQQHDDDDAPFADTDRYRSRT